MRLNGLSSREVERSRKEYGMNSFTQMPGASLAVRLAGIAKKPTILAGLVMLAVQAVLSGMGDAQLSVVMEMLLALAVLCGVSAAAELVAERTARKLHDEEQLRGTAKIVRDGTMTELPFDQVVVGDMILLQSGDRVPADGEIAYGRVIVDQSALGGSAEAEKLPAPERVRQYDAGDLSNRFYVCRSSVVCSGEAYMYVKAVGDKTLLGKRVLQKQFESPENLPVIGWTVLCTQRAFVGYFVALCILAAASLSALLSGRLLSAGVSALALTAAAVFLFTEGRHILTRCFVTKRLQTLLTQHLLVKDVHILSRLGKIKVLLADKTGNFTDGQFSVRAVTLADGSDVTNLSETSPALLTELCIGMGINNSAGISGVSVVGGNRTDRAMLSFLMQADVMDSLIRYHAVRFQEYDPERKYASAVVPVNGTEKVYLKGDVSVIGGMCRFYLDREGRKHPLSAPLRSSTGRTVGVAVKEQEDVIWISTVSLEDHERPEAAELANLVKTRVIVVTSGSDTDQNVRSALLPKDKVNMVKEFQEQGMPVAVLFDSVHDVEAMRAADVAIAPKNADEAAKQAADIIMTDDNLLSLKQLIP